MTRPDSSDDDLSPAEARALAALRTSVEPSADVKRRVLADLRSRRAFRSPYRWAVRVAAVAGFVLAYYAGARSVGSAPAAAAGPQYAFFLMNTPVTQWPDTLSAPQIVTAFREWAAPLATAARLASADELAPDFYLVNATGARAGDTAAGVNGFFVVTAADDSAAIALARSLPSVQYGGEVSVQRLMSR